MRELGCRLGTDTGKKKTRTRRERYGPGGSYSISAANSTPKTVFTLESIKRGVTTCDCCAAGVHTERYRPEDHDKLHWWAGESDTTPWRNFEKLHFLCFLCILYSPWVYCKFIFSAPLFHNWFCLPVKFNHPGWSLEAICVNNCGNKKSTEPVKQVGEINLISREFVAIQTASTMFMLFTVCFMG